MAVVKMSGLHEFDGLRRRYSLSAFIAVELAFDHHVAQVGRQEQASLRQYTLHLTSSGLSLRSQRRSHLQATVLPLAVLAQE